MWEFMRESEFMQRIQVMLSMLVNPNTSVDKRWKFKCKKKGKDNILLEENFFMPIALSHAVWLLQYRPEVSLVNCPEDTYWIIQ